MGSVIETTPSDLYQTYWADSHPAWSNIGWGKARQARVCGIDTMLSEKMSEPELQKATLSPDILYTRSPESAGRREIKTALARLHDEAVPRGWCLVRLR